jgi:predicted aspartyl protease
MTKSVNRIVATLLYVVAIVTCASARMVDHEPVGVIPFSIAEDNRIYVTAVVNGSDSLNFLVDTGASSIVLNTNSPKLKGFIHEGETTQNLGSTGENDIEYSNDNSVDIGTIH